MHDAIRSICSDVQAGGPGQRADMERFERTQSELIRLLADFKTRVLALGSVVERADRAMYRGKAAGRDCHVFADD